MNEEQKPLGILCVHGIGKQAKGSTLLDFCEPIYKWIERWTKDGETNESGIEAEDTVLNPDDDAPAHARWKVWVKQKDGTINKEQWLLAEAWWAESFAEAGFSKPLWWIIKIGPWMIFSHFFSLFRRIIAKDRPNYYLWLFVIIIHFFTYIPLAVLLMPLVQVIALVLLLLSFIPISSLQSLVVSPAQSIISNWIGDSYFLITSPLRRVAMINRVRRELQWLEKRCSKVVIVAHSQGAAIMNEVLQEKHSDMPRYLISLGSGLKLLSTIKYIDNDSFFQFVSIVSLLIPPAFIYFLIYPASWLILASILFMFGILLFIGYSARPLSPIKADLEKFGKNFRWLDLYASLDPASNGELFERELDRPFFLQSREVYNQANMFTDHSTYWQNSDEFITEVVRAISDFSGLNLTNLTYDDAETISRAKELRARRVKWMSVSRIVAMVLSVLILVLFYFRIVPSLVNDATVEGIIWFLNQIESLKGVLTYIPGEWLDILIRTITLLCIPLLWYLITKWVWNQWDGFETGLFFRRKVGKGSLFSSLFLTVMIVGILAIVGILYPDQIEGPVTVAKAFLGFFLSSAMPAYLASIFIMRLRAVSEDKRNILSLQASLLTGVVYAILDSLPNWAFPSISVFCGGIFAIPFLVLFYDSVLAPKLAFMTRIRALLERTASRPSTVPAGAARDHKSRFSSAWRRYAIFAIGAGLAIWTWVFHLDLRSPAIIAFSIFALGPFIALAINALEGKDRDHISRGLAIIGVALVIIVACMALALTSAP